MTFWTVISNIPHTPPPQAERKKGWAAPGVIVLSTKNSRHQCKKNQTKTKNPSAAQITHSASKVSNSLSHVPEATKLIHLHCCYSRKDSRHILSATVMLILLCSLDRKFAIRKSIALAHRTTRICVIHTLLCPFSS